MSCPRRDRCALHQRLDARSPLTVWQILFCDSGFDRCVRYRLTTAGAPVPPDLLPDGRTFPPELGGPGQG
jgi:hypothetical protein